jgi:outer membrane lipoprotein-sorting protein
VRRRRSSSALAASALVLWLGSVLIVAGCATVPSPRQPVSAEAQAARGLLERRWEEFKDLRAQVDIKLRRGNRVQRLAGVLVLRAPSSLRFEALSPFGTPLLVVAGDAKSLTVWEVLEGRAYLLPSSPEANRRWLGVALGGDDLVAILSGRVLPLRDPLAVELLPPDEQGPSLSSKSADGSQRIWFDPASGRVKAVEWTGGSTPARVTFPDGPADAPPAGLTLATLDGKLEVTIKYQDPRLNTGFDPELMTLSVPEHVRIQDLR